MDILGVADTAAPQVQPPPYSEPGTAYGFPSASAWNPPPYSPHPYPGPGQLPGAVGPLPNAHIINSERVLTSVPIYAESASAVITGNCPNCEVSKS